MTIMKKSIRVMALIFALVMMMPLVVLAEVAVPLGVSENTTDFEYYLDENGNAVIVGYKGSDSEVVIPSIIAGYSVTTIGNRAFSGNSNIKTLIIPDSVKKIGGYAFSYCSNMNIEIPSSVVQIDENAFYFCGIEKIVIPSSITELSDGLFFHSQLKEITLPSSLKKIGESVFYGTPLEQIEIPSSVTSIEQEAFAYCDIKSISIPNSVTELSDGIFNCSDLKEIVIPSSVKRIGKNAFYGTPLEQINIPSSVNWIGNGAFSYCSIKQIEIPPSVTYLDWYAFRNSDLETVILPDLQFDILEPAFSGCQKLKTVYGIPNSRVARWAKFQDYQFIPIEIEPIESIELIIKNVSTTGKPIIEWNTIDNANEYQLYRANSKNGEVILISSMTENTYTDAMVEAGARYYYLVKAFDKYGNYIAYSNTVSRLCDLPAPEISISNVSSSGKIKVSWDAVDGAKKYEVYRATSKSGTYKKLITTTKTSLTNTSTEAGKTYYYKVKAIHDNANANSAYSSIKYRTCDLARPTVKISNVESSGKIKLTWNAVEGAEKYEVYRATSKTGTYKKLITTTKTSLTNTSTTAGKTYYYKVKAIHAKSAANSAYSSVGSSTCDLARPVVTIGLNSSGKPRITWKAIDGAVKYEVYRATSKTGSYKKLITTTKTSLTNTSATAGKTYYYKVRAIHKSSSAATSAYSSVKYIKSK